MTFRSKYRFQQTLEMLQASPKNEHNQALCHLCREVPGSQHHEILNRYQTKGSPVAQMQSFKKTLCAWLCPKCHHVAHFEENEKKLWALNFTLYGKTTVLRDINQIQSLLRTRLSYHLPDGEETD